MHIHCARKISEGFLTNSVEWESTEKNYIIHALKKLPYL